METEKLDVYSLITKRIIEHLEKGIVPWKQSWSKAGAPKNFITKRNYHGINILLLASLGFAENYFLSFNQVKTLGGKVKKGERSCPVVFWKQLETEESGETKKKALLRYYNVFNIEQCEDLPMELLPDRPEMDLSPISQCEAVIMDMPNSPKIQHKGHKACYIPSLDIVNMPKMKTFDKEESYYSTIFHELVHSTGHKSRLNRKELVEETLSETYNYSIEELTAEIGACYLNSITGIEHSQFENNVAYIGGWLEKLKNDKRLIFYASSQAQKATDYILDRVHEKHEEPEADERDIVEVKE